MRWSNVGLLLGQRHRRWPNNKPLSRLVDWFIARWFLCESSPVNLVGSAVFSRSIFVPKWILLAYFHNSDSLNLKRKVLFFPPLLQCAFQVSKWPPKWRILHNIFPPLVNKQLFYWLLTCIPKYNKRFCCISDLLRYLFKMLKTFF